MGTTMPIISFPSRRSGACAVCGAWPEANRQAMRSLIDDEILLKEPVCDDCLLAFWERLFASEPKHKWAKRPEH